ncbi:MAG: glycosyltransferase [Promicromonosporaceae bacterium]|nr:glycosyltransferase [Promicromonosporaceae bacterium]
MRESAVVASIVIPAWRLADELAACLDGLAAQVDAPAFEVIVVVNGADPAVVAAASGHPSAPQVIELPANVGFGWACNVGAQAAVGEYLVFLNDDAQPESDWLQQLVAVARRRGAAAVASVLLNGDDTGPDAGTVQEAGAAMLRGTVTVHFGQGETVEAAEESGCLQERLIDYGSGAALLVRRQDFVALGGFDLRYSPAYYEDVDLQFRLRERAGEVWLAPLARVRHRSGGSTADRSAVRTWAGLHAGHAFVERWGDLLAGRPATATARCAPPPVSARERGPVGDLVGLADREAVLQGALRISREYVTWLEEQYAAEEGVRTRLAEILETNHHHFTRANEAEGRLAEALALNHDGYVKALLLSEELQTLRGRLERRTPRAHLAGAWRRLRR